MQTPCSLSFFICLLSLSLHLLFLKLLHICCTNSGGLSGLASWRPKFQKRRWITTWRFNTASCLRAIIRLFREPHSLHFELADFRYTLLEAHSWPSSEHHVLLRFLVSQRHCRSVHGFVMLSGRQRRNLHDKKKKEVTERHHQTFPRVCFLTC